MKVSVDALLSGAAGELRCEASGLVDQLVQIYHDEIPELWKDEDLADPLLASIAEELSTVLCALEGRVGLDAVEIPASAVDHARRFAQRGRPLSALLRTYRLAQDYLLKRILEEVCRLTGDSKLINATTTRAIALSFEYVDRAAEQTVAAYQQERDRWLQRRLSVVNEAGMRVGTTLDITRTSQELADIGIEHIADLVVVDLLESVLQGHDAERLTAPVVLRRVAQQSILDGCPEATVEIRQTHTYPEESALARALATGQPSRHRIEASHAPDWAVASPDRIQTIDTYRIHSMLAVPLRARGTALGMAQFFRHHTVAPFNDDDLLLAQEVAARAAVYIDNARRYTHERSTALTLQRSLLPQRLPELSAVEVAARYLPAGAHAGVGGDWYDVIPLSGARVALVVGDVVGHGIRASATMGRLRTAVRTLADVDVTPDEVLTRLDDVVTRLQREESPATDEIVATCLYAVYDPVSRRCSLASAGHLLPAVVTPGGVVNFPDLPIGPPLGLGGLPFETAEFELQDGSLLALYTDGLVEAPARDIEIGLALIRDVLSRPAASSIEERCDTLLATLLPGRPTDDIALLLVRTRTLDAGQVAVWNIPADPAAVSDARRHTSDQLIAWGLEDAIFTTELVVSELVTNAIRYGAGPIQLRLIRQATLICEVSDAGNTAPHLRRARIFDEGGRGLLLVAQLTESWGTRFTRSGKIIWAEQSLPDAHPMP
ncbi:SpoIIE family protein phosphatase (plasmid) [Embleya sp. NBC_00888]|uniref:ATP-binding SpoIIE family protein phosphatase n=1 Tax=Embleya sp. NBC_00888 TaxID=2975960 RepID=UPI00386767B4|nr:SpoIIE family protein phosphatase [Embleya sp. NBC_00888]